MTVDAAIDRVVQALNEAVPLREDDLPGYAADLFDDVQAHYVRRHEMADEHYDAIVIGTSRGGRFLPVELAKAGQRVALVEREHLGGVCVNKGCTPTKNDGRQRAPRLPGAPRGGVRRACWSGIGGHGGGTRAQTGHGRRRTGGLRERLGTGWA